MSERANTGLEERTAFGQVAARHVLSVGIVGAGEIVSRIHLPTLSACEGIRIAYIADKSPEAARSAGNSYKIAPLVVSDDAETLPRTDVALIAVPVSARSPYYELFAQRGTCVFAEKPLAVTGSDAEHVCSLFPDYALASGFQRRSYANIGLAKAVVAENWFGPLRSMRVAEGALTTKTGADRRFYDDVASGGGVLMDLGCHSLDAAIYITDATEAVPVKQRFVFDGAVDREVEAHLMLATPQGPCELEYLVSWLRPAKNSIELQFDHCTVEVSCRPSAEVVIRGAKNGGAKNGRVTNHCDAASLRRELAGAATTYQAFYMEWRSFLEGVRTGQVSAFSARSCLPTIRAIEALYRAGRQNR